MKDTVLIGDVFEKLKEIAPGSVQCVVTSPPYFALRDYLGDAWEGGTDPECDHMVPGSKNAGFNERWNNGEGAKKQEEQGRRPFTGNTCPRCGAVRVSPWVGGDPACDHTNKNARPDHSQGAFVGTRGEQGSAKASSTPMRGTCTKCGAVRAKNMQIGLEETPAEYVAKLVEVFRLVRECLKDDGVVWLNLGDTYAGGGCGARDKERWPKQSRNDHMPKHAKKHTGFKNKDKMMIPHRVAIALQDDGWWVRQDVVWSKANPMPESVNDRPTCSHEYVFLLTKSEAYFYDAAAIREPQTGNAHPRGNGQNPKTAAAGSGIKQNDSFQQAINEYIESDDGMRNARSVWTINSQPYKGAHFAVFPPELAKRCILAGSRPGETILDPFFGSGTVGMVAQSLGRSWLGVELNARYLPLIRERTTGKGGQIGLAL